MTREEQQMESVIVKAELEKLTVDGVLTPDRVVKAAKSPKHPLHKYFEWDLAKASYAHWLDQARSLIRSVEVIFTVEDRPVAVNYFVRDPKAEAGDQGYATMDAVLKDPEQAALALQNELARVIGCLVRAEDLAAVIGRKPEVTAVRKRVETLKSRHLPQNA